MKKTLLFLLIFSASHVFSQNSIDWISLEQAKEKAKISNKKILIYFYKKDCKYCLEMKKETLEDQEVISFINNNFHAVKIDSRTKDTIEYNSKKYSNQQPLSDGEWWRHDFYFEVSKFQQNGKDQITTPTLVIFDQNFKKINCGPYGVLAGKHSKQRLLRTAKNCF